MTKTYEFFGQVEKPTTRFTFILDDSYPNKLRIPKKEWIIRIEKKNYQLIQNELVNSSLALWHKNKQILKENQKRRETTSNQWATVKWTKRKPIGYYHSRDTLAP